MTTEPLSTQDFLAELEKIRRSYPPEPRPNPTSPDWLERNIGRFANEPLFEEMVKYVEEQRELERQEANRVADEAEVTKV